MSAAAQVVIAPALALSVPPTVQEIAEKIPAEALRWKEASAILGKVENYLLLTPPNVCSAVAELGNLKKLVGDNLTLSLQGPTEEELKEKGAREFADDLFNDPNSPCFGCPQAEAARMRMHVEPSAPMIRLVQSLCISR